MKKRFFQVRFEAPGDPGESLDEVALLRYALDKFTIGGPYHSGRVPIPDLGAEQGVEVEFKSSYGREA